MRVTPSLHFLPALWLATACTTQAPSGLAAGGALELDVTDSAITGTFDGSTVPIAFAASATAPDRAAVTLTLPRMTLDIELDQAAHTLVEDPHGGVLSAVDQIAMLALRDLLNLEHPELHAGLHGSLLVRMLDRFAEAPSGIALERHETTYTPRAPAPSLIAGCGEDGVRCLPGTSGSTYAVYDGAAGNCTWKLTSYGDSQCAGRCGAGCNFFDNDYTWDCLDHDRCLSAYGGSVLSGNPNCGDEFWEASDDYIATVGPLCFGGSLRGSPPSP
jgi:hypothetical protein